MRRLAALVAAVAATLLVLVAPPASAGGPTSVLVVNYDGARASAALTGSAEYAALERALDPYVTPTGDALAQASFMNTRLRLTWMIHDVTPWRVDAISIDGTDVWIETTMSLADGTSLFEAPTIRHRAKDAALLLNTLGELGVLGDPKPVAGAAPHAAASGTAGAPPAAAPAATASTGGQGTSGPSGGLPWWATTATAVLALGLGVVLGRRVRPRADPPSGRAMGATQPGRRRRDAGGLHGRRERPPRPELTRPAPGRGPRHTPGGRSRPSPSR